MREPTDDEREDARIEEIEERLLRERQDEEQDEPETEDEP